MRFVCFCLKRCKIDSDKFRLTILALKEHDKGQNDKEL